MFLKLMIFFLFVWLIAMTGIVLVAKQIKSVLGRNAPPPKKDHNHHQQEKRLVTCQNCGTYILENQALQVNDCYYCNQQCQKENTKS